MTYPHVKQKCKHGKVIKTCRCPGGVWVIVPCDCPEDSGYVHHAITWAFESTPERAELDRVAKILIDAWEKAEGEKVGVSYIATFVDMARAIIEDGQQHNREMKRGT